MAPSVRSLVYAGVEFVTTKRAAHDEFLAWLRLANAGMLHDGNVYAMDWAIERLPSSAPVLEIGSFCGLSANAMTYLLGKHGKPNRLVTCDKWIFEDYEGENLGTSDIPHTAFREHVKETFLRNVRFFSRHRLPHTIEVFSDEFFDLWKRRAAVLDVFDRSTPMGGPISFAYIDGNHTYPYAKRDFEHTDRHLEVGGFILFDDSSDRNLCGLTRLMREVEHTGRYEVVMKNPNYLFRKTRASWVHLPSRA